MLLVTGATGHIGNNLVQKLIQLNYSVRILRHKSQLPPSLENLPLDVIQGSLLDPLSLEKACQGVTTVIHLASIVTILPDNQKQLEETNIQGTYNIIQACKKAQVKKLIYCSSIHAFRDIPHGPIIDENVPVDPDQAIGNYGRTKALATKLVMEAFENNEIEGCIIHPTGVVGVHDYFHSLMGRTIRGMVKNRIFFTVGGYDFVDVDDVVQGILIVEQKGVNKERYLISGHYTTTKNLKYAIDDLMNRRHFAINLPRWTLKMFLPFVSITYFIAKLLRIKMVPLLTSDSEQILFSNSNITSVKLEKLGYKATPFKETLKKTIQWYGEQGYL